jgi:hypothetical protein
MPQSSEPAELLAEEINQAVKILERLQPGMLPPAIFLEIARLTVTPILEIVPLRLTEDGVKVLLLKRDEDDPIWAGKLHTPGTIIRANDKENDFTDAFERILKKELSGTALVANPIYVERIFHEQKRGRELAEVYYVEIQGELLVGKLYDADNMPPGIVDTQIPFIENAVNKFKKDKQLI